MKHALVIAFLVASCACAQQGTAASGSAERAAGSPSAKTVADLYVSLSGNDTWSGTIPDPNAGKTDGPLASMAGALAKVRTFKTPNAVTINVRGGTYFLKEPIRITGEDVGAEQKLPDGRIRPVSRPLAILGYKDEAPVFSGGSRITGFKEIQLNGRGVWTADLPAVREGKWYFRQLWVGGQRAYRAGIPAGDGLLKVHQSEKGNWSRGQDQFSYDKNQLAGCKDTSDVEASVFSYWTNDLIAVKSIDHAARRVTLAEPNSFGRLGDASYRLENVLEALTEPGTWVLRRRTGTLYYLPRAGEKPDTTEVIAPVLDTLLLVEGTADRMLRGVRFEGITFRHNLARPYGRPAMQPQAAWPISGAIVLQHVWGATFRNCRIENIGSYGLECRVNTRDVTLSRCVLTDLGAGGVKLWDKTERTTIEDCDIGPGGRVFHGACGVLIGRSNGNRIIHNDIHDFDYSGVNIGWNWGPGENCFGNVVEWNRIRNIGNGKLSDLAGVYFLGVQNGTRVRYNVISNVTCAIYGAWGFYGDGWASGILIEGNIVAHTTSGAFHTNVGVNLELYNNIFAFNRNYQLTCDYPGAAHGVTMRRNIILSDGQKILNDPWFKLRASDVTASDNLVYDLRAGSDGEKQEAVQASLKLLGQGSIYANPGFRDPGRGDFTLPNDSPARTIGFVPLDLSAAGPRKP